MSFLDVQRRRRRRLCFAATASVGSRGIRERNFLRYCSGACSKSYRRRCRVLLFTTFSGFPFCLAVFALSTTIATAALSAVIRVWRFGAMRSFLRGFAFRSPTIATGFAVVAGGGSGLGSCLMMPMMLLLLMMPLRHCREHLLTNGFGHRRHFDVPLCPLNSIPVVEL